MQVVSKPAPLLLWVGLVLLVVEPRPARGQWPQWGGAERNFTANAAGLADKWPEGGPTRLWQRELGTGYSAIVSDGEQLYTMYRKELKDPNEYAIALNAKTGETVWEHQNPAKIEEDPDERWGGHGPNATPLLVADRLFTVGSRGVVHCFAKDDGKVLWRRDLQTEYGLPLAKTCGHCPSPIAYRDLVILAMPHIRENNSLTPGSTKDCTFIALAQGTGETVWKGLEFQLDFSSPILINFAGQDQLVQVTDNGLVALDPADGKLLWRHDTPGTSATPIWNGNDLLFYVSTPSAQEMEGRVVKLTRQGERTVPQEVWSSRKIRLHLGSPALVGDMLVGGSDRLLLGFDFATGKRKWLERGYEGASCIYADDKLIILDQDGNLTLASIKPKHLKVHGKCKISERYSLTVPTLVGKTLYVRDRKHIMALDLG